jgi:hypothetical protein
MIIFLRYILLTSGCAFCKFMMETWDSHEIEYVSHFRMNLTQSPLDTATKWCRSPDEHECIASAIQTHVNRRFDNVMRLVMSSGDDDSISSALFFSRAIHATRDTPSTVCMFGDISLEIVLFTLMYCSHCSVIIGSSSPVIFRLQSCIELFRQDQIHFHPGYTLLDFRNYQPNFYCIRNSNRWC